MEVLITGAAGFIGRALVARLRAGADAVRCARAARSARSRLVLCDVGPAPRRRRRRPCAGDGRRRRARIDWRHRQRRRPRTSSATLAERRYGLRLPSRRRRQRRRRGRFRSRHCASTSTAPATSSRRWRTARRQAASWRRPPAADGRCGWCMPARSPSTACRSPARIDDDDPALADALLRRAEARERAADQRHVPARLRRRPQPAAERRGGAPAAAQRRAVRLQQRPHPRAAGRPAGGLAGLAGRHHLAAVDRTRPSTTCCMRWRSTRPPGRAAGGPAAGAGLPDRRDRRCRSPQVAGPASARRLVSYRPDDRVEPMFGRWPRALHRHPRTPSSASAADDGSALDRFAAWRPP